MKVAVLSESPADEAAVRILVDSILGRQTQPIPYFQPRSRGWPSVLNILPSVLMHLHYRSEAEALVVVVDSDDSPLHQDTHEQPGGAELQCRLCGLSEAIARVQRQLSPISGRSAIKTAISIATPALEAWYQCGRDPHASEGDWMRGVQSRPGSPIRKRLKRDVYGTERPPDDLARKRAAEEAQRLVQNLTLLETLFPIGFGVLARDVRGW
jgi:hypothetical protein